MLDSGYNVKFRFS